jgi:hypothetical protein
MRANSADDEPLLELVLVENDEDAKDGNRKEEKALLVLGKKGDEDGCDC